MSTQVLDVLIDTDLNQNDVNLTVGASIKTTNAFNKKYEIEGGVSQTFDKHQSDRNWFVTVNAKNTKNWCLQASTKQVVLSYQNNSHPGQKADLSAAAFDVASAKNFLDTYQGRPSGSGHDSVMQGGVSQTGNVGAPQAEAQRPGVESFTDSE